MGGQLRKIRVARRDRRLTLKTKRKCKLGKCNRIQTREITNIIRFFLRAKFSIMLYFVPLQTVFDRNV